MFKLFAVSPPGLEPFTFTELIHLGLVSKDLSDPPRASLIGGVEFSGSLNAIYHANLHLRTAHRVLLRLGEFHAAAFSELNRYTQHLPWRQFLKPGQDVAVRVTCHKSRLYHSTAVAREVIKAINKTLAKPVASVRLSDEDQSGDFPQLIIVRLVNDNCTISIDTSGHLLHRRGYRQATAKAPLRETLAAGLLFASGWDYASPLLDPFCGSGTIAIEAALLAHQIPPGLTRQFAFMNWPDYNYDLWFTTLTSAQSLFSEPILNRQQRNIIASDRDAGAIKIARSNAERAGVAQYIQFSQRAVSAIEPIEKGWLVTNPPYGIRVNNNKDLRNLYAQLGKIMRNKCAGCNFTILCSELSLLYQLNIPFDSSLTSSNGGIPVQIARGIVPE